jgi:mannosyltransferase
MAVVADSQDLIRRSGRTTAPAVSSRTGWILGAIILLGVVVRFTTLNQQSFWFDEATTWGIVDHGLGHVFNTVPKTESTPPLYYVLLWLWAQVFGTGEVGLRSLSAVFSTLTIPVVWLIGRRLVSDRVGLIAALLAAVNPLLFWYAQEARSYSLLLLLSAVALLAFVEAVESPTWRRLLLWGLASAVAFAAHYYAAVMIVSEGAYLAVMLHRRRRLTLDRVAAAAVPVLVVVGALAPLMLEQNDGRAGYIATQAGSLPYRIAQLVKEDIIGQGQPEKALLTALGCALVVVALALLLRRSRRAAQAPAVMMLTVGVGGVLVAVAVAIVGTDYFNTRNLLPTWPALMMVVAIGLASKRARRVGVVATAGLAVLSLVCVWNIVSDPLYQRPDWRGAAQRLGVASAPRAIVADVQSQVPLEPYLSRLSLFPSGGAAVREVDVIWLQRAYQWGPLGAISSTPLPGFALVKVIRTQSYVVERYRAVTPQAEARTTLDRLYPLAPRALALLQGG